MMTLGREIKRARIKKGWQQKELREATGLSLKYLSQIENDHVDPRISIVKRIAGALGVSIDKLVEDDDPSESETGAAVPELVDA